MAKDRQLADTVIARDGNIQVNNMAGYEALTELSARIHTALSDQPRCINCDKNIDGYCEKFKADIPEQHKAEVTDCEHWEPLIPF